MKYRDRLTELMSEAEYIEKKIERMQKKKEKINQKIKKEIDAVL